MLGQLPTRPYNPQRYTPATGPVRPDQVVTDRALRLFTTPKLEYQRGEITSEDQAILSMILPDVMAELLAYRRTARGKVQP